MMISQLFLDPYLMAILKGTAVIGLAWLATSMLRRHSAATRHFVWSLAMVGLVALPILVPLTPGVPLPLLPAGRTSQSPGGDSPGQMSGLTIDLMPSVDVALAPSPAGPIAVEFGPPDALPDVPPEAGVAVAVPQTWSATVDLASMVAGQPGRFLIDRAAWLMILAWLWIGGTLLCLARLGYGMLVVSRVVRHALPVIDPAWYANLEAVRRTLGIGREVHLKQTDRVGVPIVWGVRSPVVILPLAAAQWSPDAQRAVLLHELAHVSRFDAVSQAIAQLACAIYWFSPFVWLAARSQQREQEHACDDRVLDAGTAASAYARNLLDIVQSLGPIERRGPALAMARSSLLHGRLRAILDPGTRRHRVSGAMRGVTTAVALLLILPLAGMRLVEQPPRWDGDLLARLADAAVTAPSAETPATAPVVDLAPDPTSASLSGQLKNRLAVAVTIRTDTLCRYATGRRSISDNSEGKKRWTVEWTGDDCRVEVRSEGEVVYAEDLRSVVSISVGGHLQIDVQRGDQRRDMMVRPVNGSLEYRWRVNGTIRAFDESARSWLAEVLVALDRETAFAIDSRYPRLWQGGGVQAVLQETQGMSDHARALYYQRLLQEPDLSAADVRLVMAQAAEVMTSDYSTSLVLEAVAMSGLEDPVVRQSFLEAIAGMESDHFRGSSLVALMEYGPLTTEEAQAVVSGARSIDSDYTRAMVLQELLNQPNLDDATVILVAEAASELSSDHSVAQVLAAMVDTDRFAGAATDPAVRSAFLNATRAMESDHSLQTVLMTLIEPGGLTTAEVAMVLDGSSTIESDHARTMVLQALVTTNALSNEQLVRAIALTAGMASDHQKGMVLAAVVERGPPSAQVREAIVDAASSMSSPYQRDHVLAALAAASQ